MGKNKKPTEFSAKAKIEKLSVQPSYEYDTGKGVPNGGAHLWMNENTYAALSAKEVKELHAVLGNIIAASEVVSK